MSPSPVQICFAYLFNWRNMGKLDWIRSNEEKQVVSSRAGFQLKYMLKHPNVWDSTDLKTQKLVLENVMGSLAAPIPLLRDIVGMVLTQIGSQSKQRLDPYPQIIKYLSQSMFKPNKDLAHGCLSVLYHLCDEAYEALESDGLGRPLNNLVGLFIKLFKHPNPVMTKKAIDALIALTKHKSVALQSKLPLYLENLKQLIDAKRGVKVNKTVCVAYSMILSYFPTSLESHLDQVIRFILQTMWDGESEELRLQVPTPIYFYICTQQVEKDIIIYLCIPCMSPFFSISSPLSSFFSFFECT